MAKGYTNSPEFGDILNRVKKPVAMALPIILNLITSPLIGEMITHQARWNINMATGLPFLTMAEIMILFFVDRKFVIKAEKMAIQDRASDQVFEIRQGTDREIGQIKRGAEEGVDNLRLRFKAREKEIVEATAEEVAAAQGQAKQVEAHYLQRLDIMSIQFGRILDQQSDQRALITTEEK